MVNFFAKLKQGLSKTRSNIVDSIESVFTSHDKIDDDFYEELEEILVMGDVGIHATEEILDELKLAVKKRECRKPDECREYLIDVIKEKMRVTESDYEFLDKPSVVMVIGVNGVGKTTTIGKLAHIYRNKGKSVLIAAADTFRAAASEQLEIWAERAGVDMIGANDGADPSSVIYDAVNAARSRHVDVLLCDTAGRLHNKKNLMNELEKMNRIIDKNYPGVKRENLIVLDATTGQNALNQAREFGEVAPLSGIVLTKMDGTAKGGIAIAIQSELGIPVKFIGVGEGIDDLQEFDSDTFVNALFDVKMEEEDAFA
ncbi:MAG: signal recognition particle-docking protein FtsY [Lachnospiraceae bacterium]|nr:signal recognition particle-docking protein FtsY [Lachnospiraceae bacterium]